MSTFWPFEPPGSGNDLSWAGPGRPVLDPLVDHSHRCPGRHAVADLTCPPAVGGKSHTLLQICSQKLNILLFGITKKISAPPSFSYLTSAAISLYWSSYFSPLLFFPDKGFIFTYPFHLTRVDALMSIFQLSLSFIFHSFLNLFFPLPCCPLRHLLSSVASSNAPSRAATMRRSTTAPTWGSSPRRWRSRRQNYNTMNISLWPALPSSSPSRR